MTNMLLKIEILPKIGENAEYQLFPTFPNISWSDNAMDEYNTILSAYTKYRHLG